MLLHLALKAFYPGKPPFPLLHIDTTWKFREMIAFRDRRAHELGLDLIVHTNADGLARGISPITHGSELHTDVMKTQALRQALDAHGFDAALGGARRDEEKSRAKERVFSLPQCASPLGSEAAAPGTVAPLQCPQAKRRKHARVSAVELDRARHLALHPSGEDPGRAALFRRAAAGGRARRHADHGRRRAAAARARRNAADAERPLPHARLLSAHRRDRERRREPPEIIRETVEARFSERRDRVIDHDGAASMERKKQEGYF